MIDTLSLLVDGRSENFDSRYRVVLVAAQRAKYMMRENNPPDRANFTKETSLALEEALQGKVEYLIGKDAREAMRDAKRKVGREFDKSLLNETDEDAREIKQQLSVYIDDTPKEPEPVVEEDSTEG